jgi:hypothetical protein
VRECRGDYVGAGTGGEREDSDSDSGIWFQKHLKKGDLPSALTQRKRGGNKKVESRASPVSYIYNIISRIYI